MEENKASKFLMPDFIIIGAGKSGTTSLDSYLSQHPEIFISPRKEPNFFGYELKTAEDFEVESDRTHYEISITDLDDYSDLYKEAKSDQLKGETSNAYLYQEEAVVRIKHHVPDVKLMAILRHPVERLYSRYLHLARDNRLPTEQFEDCLDQESIWWWRNDLVREGFYFKNLSRYYELFSSQQIKVFLFDDLRSDSPQMLKDVYNFLGVDNTFEADLSLEYNKSGFIKNPMLNEVFGGKGLVRKALGKVLPGAIFNNLREQKWLYQAVDNLRNKNLAKPKLDPELKNKITNEIYREDILKLQDLIGRDLGHWL